MKKKTRKNNKKNKKKKKSKKKENGGGRERERSSPQYKIMRVKNTSGFPQNLRYCFLGEFCP